MNGWAVPAVAYLAVVGTVLAVTDWRTQRLPNVVVAPSYPIAAALIVLAMTAGGDSWSPLGWAAVGAPSVHRSSTSSPRVGSRSPVR